MAITDVTALGSPNMSLSLPCSSGVCLAHNPRSYPSDILSRVLNASAVATCARRFVDTYLAEYAPGARDPGMTLAGTCQHTVDYKHLTVSHTSTVWQPAGNRATQIPATGMLNLRVAGQLGDILSARGGFLGPIPRGISPLCRGQYASMLAPTKKPE